MYVPPPADQLEKRLQVLCDFANQENAMPFIHPAVKAIILHFWLSYEHPYVDGNGRTARALFYWYMLKKEYWLFEFISISRILLKAVRQYARAFLYSEYDGNDLCYFMAYHLRAIQIALGELEIYLQRKQREYQQAAQLLQRFPGINQRQQWLLTDALRSPHRIYTIKGYQAQSKIVYQTARADLLGLVQMGLFNVVPRGRRFIFMPSQDLLQKLKSAHDTGS